MGGFLSPEFIIQFLVAVTGAGGVSAAVTAWRDKRKADAQAEKENASAVEILEGVTGRYAQRAENQLLEMDKKLDEERDLRKEAQAEARAAHRESRIARDEAREARAEVEMLLANQRLHEEWDRRVLEVLRRRGEEIEEPPTLQLPRSLQSEDSG